MTTTRRVAPMDMNGYGINKVGAGSDNDSAATLGQLRAVASTAQGQADAAAAYGADLAHATGQTGSASISDFAAQATAAAKAVRLDQFAAPGASVAMGGYTLTGLPNPTADGQPATKGYADKLLADYIAGPTALGAYLPYLCSGGGLADYLAYGDRLSTMPRSAARNGDFSTGTNKLYGGLLGKIPSGQTITGVRYNVTTITSATGLTVQLGLYVGTDLTTMSRQRLVNGDLTVAGERAFAWPTTFTTTAESWVGVVITWSANPTNLRLACATAAAGDLTNRAGGGIFAGLHSTVTAPPATGNFASASGGTFDSLTPSRPWLALY